ncbi:ribokinase [Protomyces lactucae-debilis]|uniref:Ribokinase n=1 Tax=Protomyces lactucae-debilis TaxID=2754530 RepID=A0A1Y2EYL6_PROLT|nr:ribokinase [Protomyces lactucae-debilis]ORY76660.1 ribokinase [Protomyces lactucae-debilis]
MPKPIVVVGSVNVDLVAQCKRAPDAGETLYGRDFHAGVGGKGLNQAAACALLSQPGPLVHMVACIGNDPYAAMCRDAMAKLHIQMDQVLTEDTATGIAMITVEDSGDNRILYIPGANELLSVKHIDKAAALIREAAVIVCQLESPMETVLHALALAHEAGVPTLLNPAPVQALPHSLYKQLSYLIPNETEAALLSGMKVETPDDAIRVGEHFLRLGVQEAVIVTLGGQGSVVVTRDGSTHVPSKKVKAIDTTAAGDSFIGGDIHAAVQYGTAVASITVTRSGASSSIPSLSEVERSMQ